MPMIKDYYRILNIKSSASPAEVKRAYRKLAMAYHPDRNPNDALATAVFTDIAEAYSILSDEQARRQYHEERYVTAEQEYRRPAETVDKLIQRIAGIHDQVKNTDPFRLNKDALLYAITQLFPDDVALLLQTNDILLGKFLELVCTTAAHLSSAQVNQLLSLLQPLYHKHIWLQQKLTVLMLEQQKRERWQKNKIIVAVVLAILLCAIIFFAASA